MLLNEEVEIILTALRVNKKPVDYAYLFYNGHADEYIVYTQSDTTNSYSSDDDIAGVVAVYDFDVYSKGNYSGIANALKRDLRQAGWTWQPNRDSQDLYDVDTGYYHKTFAFAKPIQINYEEV